MNERAFLADDDRFESERDRCEIYLMLSQWGRAMTSADYAAVEAGSCAEKFPFEAYPWKS